MQRRLLVENHWHTLGTVRDLIALYTEWGKPEEATKWFDVLKAANADQSGKSRYSSAKPGTMSYDRVKDTHTLVAPMSPSWAIVKEFNFSLPEPSSEMWNVCDDLYFAYKTLDGDGSITTKIESITPTHYTTQVGLMIRSTLEPTSPNASVVVNPLGDIAFQYRDVELGTTRSRYDINKIRLPHWVRLTRKGDRLAAQHSSDGVQWEGIIDPPDPYKPTWIEIPMNETIYIGLAVSSHNTSRTAEARISNVTVTGLASPSGPFVHSKDITVEISPDHSTNK